MSLLTTLEVNQMGRSKPSKNHFYSGTVQWDVYRAFLPLTSSHLLLYFLPLPLDDWCQCSAQGFQRSCPGTISRLGFLRIMGALYPLNGTLPIGRRQTCAPTIG